MNSQKSGGIDVDGAGIDMFPGPARQMMTKLSQTATDTHNGWSSAIGKIMALEARLGQGPLGKAFAKGYNDTVGRPGPNGPGAGLVKTVGDLLSWLDKVVEVGTTSVTNYENADQRAGQHLKS